MIAVGASDASTRLEDTSRPGKQAPTTGRGHDPLFGCFELATVAGGGDLDTEAVGVEEERRVVVRVVPGEQPRRVQNRGAGLARRGMCGVDVVPGLDREREVMEPGCVELECLLLLGLPQPGRARARYREAEVMDELAALAGERHG